MPARNITRGGAATSQRPPTGQRARAEVVRDDADEESCENCGIAIGQCGCSGGATGSVTSQPPAWRNMARPAVNVAAARQAANDAAAAAAAAEAAAAASGDWTIALRPNPGCYPRKMSGNLDGMGQMLAGYAGNPAPYSDPAWDYCNMDSLYSDITDVAAGATVSIPVTPNQGTFGAFYWDVLAVDDATGVEVDDWEVDQPFVQGCPTPCDVNGPILAQFSQQVPEQCCGKPFRAFLDEESRNAPLNVPFTNNSAGVMRVQVRVRGYCCSDKVCW